MDFLKEREVGIKKCWWGYDLWIKSKSLDKWKASHQLIPDLKAVRDWRAKGRTSKLWKELQDLILQSQCVAIKPEQYHQQFEEVTESLTKIEIAEVRSKIASAGSKRGTIKIT